MSDLYAILEVAPTASDEVIKTAYRALAKKYHPDVYGGDKDYAEQKMKQINAAYEILSDPVKRREYDSQCQNHVNRNSGTDSDKAAHREDHSHTTNEQTPHTAKANDEKPNAPSQKSVPIHLRWWAIMLLFCTGLTSWLAVFFAFRRVMYNRKHPECKLPLKLRRVLWGVTAVCLCLCVLGLIMPEYEPQDPSMSDNQSQVIDHDKDDDTNTPASEPENQTSSNEPDVQDTTQSTTAATDETISEPTLTPTEAGIETEPTTTPTRPIPTEPEHTENTSDNRITSIANPDYLMKFDNVSVKAINGDYALVLKRDNNEQYYVLYNLKKEKEMFSIEYYPNAEGFLEGYIGSNLSEEYQTIVTKLTDLAGNTICETDDNVKIYTVFYDHQLYLAKRNVATYSFSGWEYAIFDFDGNVTKNWTKDTEADGWEYMGDGMYYLPNSKMLYDALNDRMSAWPNIDYEAHKDYGRNEPGYIDMDLIKNGYDISEYPTVHLTDFDADGCLMYFDGPYIDDPASFYSIDRQGNYKLIHEVENVHNVEYLESTRSFYYCTIDCSVNYAYHKDLKIFDMYGNLAFDLSAFRVIDYTLGSKYVGLKIWNADGNGTEAFYTVIDQSGNMLFEPILCTDAEVEVLMDQEIFYIADYDGLVIYDFTGQRIGKIDPISITETAFIFPKKRTYTPVSFEVYGDYYAVQCEDLEDYKARTFIGKVKS